MLDVPLSIFRDTHNIPSFGITGRNSAVRPSIGIDGSLSLVKVILAFLVSIVSPALAATGPAPNFTTSEAGYPFIDSSYAHSNTEYYNGTTTDAY